MNHRPRGCARSQFEVGHSSPFQPQQDAHIGAIGRDDRWVLRKVGGGEGGHDFKSAWRRFVEAMLSGGMAMSNAPDQSEQEAHDAHNPAKGIGQNQDSPPH